MSLTIKLKAPNGREWEQPIGLFINNEFVESSQPDEKISSIDPATEKEIAAVHSASPEDVDLAVQSAKKALKSPAWKQICVSERGRIMMRLADLIEENRELLATVDAWDNGKRAKITMDDRSAYLTREALQCSSQ